MYVNASAFATAISAMRVSSRQVEQAAASIASAGLERQQANPKPDDPVSQQAAVAQPAPDPAADMAASMTTILEAQRAFLAQQRAVDAAKVMLGESIDVGAARLGR